MLDLRTTRQDGSKRPRPTCVQTEELSNKARRVHIAGYRGNVPLQQVVGITDPLCPVKCHLTDPCFLWPGKLDDKVVGISGTPGICQTLMLGVILPSSYHARRAARQVDPAVDRIMVGKDDEQIIRGNSPQDMCPANISYLRDA